MGKRNHAGRRRRVLADGFVSIMRLVWANDQNYGDTWPEYSGGV